MSLCLIYALSDPRADGTFDNIRYIGKTDRALIIRLKEHLRQLNKEHKSCWIKSLIAQGISPIIWPLAVCSKDNWKQVEKEWIARIRTIGNLTNLTNGGDGIEGYRYSDEQKKKIGDRNRGRICSQETRRKLSEAITGTKKPPFTPEHIHKFRMAKLGKKQKQEHIEAKRVANTGKRRSTESVNNIRNGIIASFARGQRRPTSAEGLKRRIEASRKATVGRHHSNEDKLKISAAVSKPVRCIETGQIFNSRKDAAKMLGIKRHDIFNSLSRSRKVKGFQFESCSV